MADRNICDVELLDSISENTNVLIEENGSLKKLNLQDEINTAINNSKQGIGEVKYTYLSTSPAPHDTTIEVGSFTVSKGTYIVTTFVYFADASSTVAGGRTVGIKKNDAIVANVIAKPYEWSTKPECVGIVVCDTDNTKISGYASQTSGSSLNISADFSLVRIA